MLEANHILGAAYNCSCLIGLLGGIACSYIRKLVARSHEMNRWPSRVKKDISRHGLKNSPFLVLSSLAYIPGVFFRWAMHVAAFHFPPNHPKTSSVGSEPLNLPCPPVICP